MIGIHTAEKYFPQGEPCLQLKTISLHCTYTMTAAFTQIMSPEGATWSTAIKLRKKILEALLFTTQYYTKTVYMCGYSIA